jgi:hypothetical protein
MVDDNNIIPCLMMIASLYAWANAGIIQGQG